MRASDVCVCARESGVCVCVCVCASDVCFCKSNVCLRVKCNCVCA